MKHRSYESFTLPDLLPSFPLLSLLSCSKEQCQKLQIRGGSYHCFRKLSSEKSTKKGRLCDLSDFDGWVISLGHMFLQKFGDHTFKNNFNI